MSTVFQYTTVKCPFDSGPGKLQEHFKRSAGIVPLRVKLGDLRLEHDVELRVTSKPGHPGYRLMDVSWEPKNGGPYPRFDGTLTVAEDAYGWSRIEIDGTYRPPFGVAGAAFDAVVGHELAETTATELLDELKRILVSEKS